jgi:ABC transporter, substrate-binding protein
MTDAPDHTWVEILNPWDTTQVLRQYLLVNQAMSSVAVKALQAQHPASVLLHTPLQRTLPQSTVHASLALRLEAQQSLVGLCDTAYIVAPELKELHLPDFGRGDQPNVERIVAAKTQACLFAPFENARYESLERAQILVVDCADYLETSPLGRAEWMRFYGRLWGKSQLADSLFACEVSSYERLKQMVHSTLVQTTSSGLAHPTPSGASQRENLPKMQSTSIAKIPVDTPNVGGHKKYLRRNPKNVGDFSKNVGDFPKNVGENFENVGDNFDNLREKENPVHKAMASREEKSSIASHSTDSVSHRAPCVWLDLPWQSTWYAPGGHSYLATLIADAGGDYPLRHNDQAGSLPLPLERAWQYAQTADVWIIKGGDELPPNYAALTALSHVYAQFPAVRSHRVWVCPTMQVPYYEHTPFAPTQLLREWGIMLGTLPVDATTSLRYFHPLPRH